MIGATNGGADDLLQLVIGIEATTPLAPGLDEETINVSVYDVILAIEGALVIQAPEGARPVWQEFGPAKFRRSLRLGAAVESSKVEALYRNGLLMITMPQG